jgi:hypothetical protein
MDTETIAVILNLAVYASLAAALLQWNRQRIPVPRDARTAFHLLEDALRRSFPDLPQGFTLREGLTRARQADPGLKWEDIDRSLAQYESFRFGDGSTPSLPIPEVMRLVRALRRMPR